MPASLPHVAGSADGSDRYRGPLNDLLPDNGAHPTDVSRDFVPRSSTDTALTSFAQLATLRVDASRALVSLLGTDNEYILAESTKSLSLQSDTRHDTNDSLWLGAVTIPRSKGVCELALEHALQTGLPAATSDDQPDNNDVFVINDMREHPRTADAPFVVSYPCLRFYAGAPIRAPDGAVIGVFCIFDTHPRTQLTEEHKLILKDLAKTTMDHLEALRVRRAYVRTNKLITGLESFVDGLTNTRTAEEAAETRTALMPESGHHHAAHDVAADTPDVDSENKGNPYEQCPDPDTPGTESKQLWDLAMMPPGSRPMFTRAANIIRQSGDYDGCAIFYVASGRRGHASRTNLRSDSPSSPHSTSSPEGPIDASDTDDSLSWDNSSSQSICPVLGYSLSSGNGGPPQSGPFPRFKQRDLEQLLAKDPAPRVYSLSRTGDILPEDTSSSGSGVDNSDTAALSGRTDTIDNSKESTRRRAKLIRQQVKSLKKLASTAMSYVCLPLWDSERQRWIGYSICWTSSPSRHLKHDGDLGYLRVFGNSIAIALSHIDTIAANQAKGTFVSSISHELRSPLHGILSATTFLKDGHMNRFEREMVGVISNCGRTLLDTLDHVMDFAKISSITPKLRRRLSANSPLNVNQHDVTQDLHPSLTSNVDLSVLVEEVVEALLVGFNVQHDFIYADAENPGSSAELPSFNAPAASLSRSKRMTKARGEIRLILQIPHRKNWHCYTQAGAWRRIIMNLFGNALKYTDRGMIVVRIDPQPGDSEKALSMRLEVVDTGKGISKHYMDTRLYTAFSQEDQLSSGSGLGLAIVKQVVGSLGGSVELSSLPGNGTTASVSLSVPVAPQEPSIINVPDMNEELSERLRGQQVYIVEDSSHATGDVSGPSAAQQAEGEFFRSVSRTLKEWFGVDVLHGASWPTDRVDIVICLKPLLKYFDKSAGDAVTRQPVLLITYDALEMAVLRMDARILRSDAVIEVTSQPLGPQKLARMLKQCLDRYEQLLAVNVGADTSFVNLSVPRSDWNTPRGSTPVQHLATMPTQLRRASSEMYRDPFVLIVDDNQLNLRLLSFFIQRQSLKYHEAQNGQEAVDIFRAAGSSVRCILMDISMPVLDGIAATKLIRDMEQLDTKRARTPIIALTGLTSAASRSEAQEAGMDEFLTKPIQFSQLGGILGQIEGLSVVPTAE